MAIETITLENGKYRFEFDTATGAFRCLRYGEEWRAFTGDKAVYSLFAFAQNLASMSSLLQQEAEESVKALAARSKELQRAREALKVPKT